MNNLAIPLISKLNHTETCRGCHTRPVDVGYRSCSTCRTKRNQQKLASKEKKKRMLYDIEYQSREDVVSGKGTNKVIKRKADDTGENSALVKKRKTVKSLLKNTGRTPLDFDVFDRSDDSTEFQSASDLYKRLKKLTSRERNLEFYACHSIVADPAVNNSKRASLVARDISKVAGLSFNYKQTIAPPIPYQNSHTLRFQCTCAAKAATSVGLNMQVQRNGSPSLLSVGQGKPSAVTQCNGIIEVTAADDNSHPLGFAGQKISIRVRHTKK